MSYLIVSSPSGKTHAVMRNRPSAYNPAMMFSDFYTLCKEDWCMDNWKTVRTYKMESKVKNTITCQRCLRAMEKK